MDNVEEDDVEENSRASSGATTQNTVGWFPRKMPLEVEEDWCPSFFFFIVFGFSYYKLH